MPGPSLRCCLSLILALAVLASACSLSSLDSSAGSFDRLQQDYDKRAILEYAEVEDAVRVCLIREGFDVSDIRTYLARNGVDQDQSHGSGVSLLDQMSELDEEARVAELGFGFAPVSVLARDQKLDASTDGSQDQSDQSEDSPALRVAFERCAEHLNYHRPAESLSEFASMVVEIKQRVAADPATIELNDDWSRCMSREGVDVSSIDVLLQSTAMASELMQRIDPLPFEAALAQTGAQSQEALIRLTRSLYGSANSWEELAMLELQIARQELDCRVSVKYEQRLNAIRDEITSQFSPSNSR